MGMKKRKGRRKKIIEGATFSCLHNLAVLNRKRLPVITLKSNFEIVKGTNANGAKKIAVKGGLGL
jgi:hypothetical protein